MKIMSIFLFLFTLFTFGCSGGGSADVTLRINKKDRSMTIMSAYFSAGDSREISAGGDATSYVFLITNFDPAGKDLDKFGPDLTMADEIKIQFVVAAEKTDDNKEMKLKPGTYRSMNSNDGEKGFWINSFRVFQFLDGKEDIWARMGSTDKSFVKIESATPDSVTGEIAFIDGDESVNGKFTAKALKKEK
ncbi:hypothetical protein BH10ACI3_BH10ACI3_24450 [soil metagenome]